MGSVNPDILEETIQAYGPTYVRPLQFFVSWYSVITLAYEGFSRSLLQMKAEIDQRVPELKRENPGSRWPKTTLACLRDSKELSREQVDDLRNLCIKHSNSLVKTPKKDRTLHIDEVSLVIFQCRTLEKRLATRQYKLQAQPLSSDDPPPWHLEQVQQVMDQFSDTRKEGYFPKLSPDGRTLYNYYRKPHIETTLVIDVEFPPTVKQVIRDFQKAITDSLPDTFAWFDPKSWHMTVRAVVVDE